jgi:hypothetical protein
MGRGRDEPADVIIIVLLAASGHLTAARACRHEAPAEYLRLAAIQD